MSWGFVRLDDMILAESSRPLCECYDVAMLDLDGVVYRGADAVWGAADALRQAHAAGMTLSYVTNNASRNPDDIAAHLNRLGMPDVRGADVVTSAQAVAHLLADAVPADSEVLVLGAKGLYDALAERGLRGGDSFNDNTVAVVQGFDPDITWRQLAEGTYAVNAGLPWFASNLDLSVPTERGIAPGNGALVGLIAQATGQHPIAAGKPEAALFDETAQRVGGNRPLVIGDRLDTDIQGAGNAGLDSLAVLTGVSDLQGIADAVGQQRPSYIATDLRGLIVAHQPVTVMETSAACGSAEVLLDGSVMSVVRAGVEADRIRAAVELAWTYRDRTGASAQLDGIIGL